MEKEDSRTFLGYICQAMALLIKEHEPSKLTFTLIKQGFSNYSKALTEATNNEVEIVQTGSSYDELHMCRIISSTNKDEIFFPLTDFDMMMVYNQFTIEDFTGPNKADKEIVDSAVKSSDHSFLMIPSNNIGYVKLKVTDKGRRQLAEKKSRVQNYINGDGFLSNDAFKEGIPQQSEPNTTILYSRISEENYVTSGPAISNFDHAHEGFTYDFVHAFRCRTWPKVAHRFNKRPRDANWPNEGLRQEIMNEGCAVVPVGYYQSSEDKLEWRLSFNFSERKLSTGFSYNQKMCYCVVKLMLKAILSPKAILSSYMVKNMMFWFCEQQYGENEWENEHLGARIVQLLEYICTALKNHNIPHYFLPFNNLIRHRSTEEVEHTLKEVLVVKNKPFQTLAYVCSSMHIFEEIKKKEFQQDDLELNALLIMYLSFAQLLFQLGMLNYDSIPFAVQCFQTVVSLNTTAGKYITRMSHILKAETVPELLKPFAIQCMQNGEIDKALLLFRCMMESDEKLVKDKFPEAIINIACLSSVKVDLVADEDKKNWYKKLAEKYFKLAEKNVKNSPSLYLAYGDFLKESKKSLRNAVLLYRKACDVVKPRDDDDSLIQITLPGDADTSPTVQYVPGKVVAYYRLVDALVDLGDTYEARKCAGRFEALIEELRIKQKNSALKLCALAYRRVGLVVKASYLNSLATRYV